MDVSFYNQNVTFMGLSASSNTIGVNYKVVDRGSIGLISPLQKGGNTQAIVSLSPKKDLTFFYSTDLDKNARGIYGMTLNTKAVLYEFAYDDDGTSYIRGQYNMCTDKAIYGVGPYLEKAKESDMKFGFMVSYIPTK